jgi:hypothetical protein
VFEEVDAKVAAFLAAHADGAKVELRPPRADVGAEAAIHAHLMELDAPVRFGAAAPAPVEVLLRYLVTVHDPDVGKGHARLGNLVAAALAQDELQAVLRPLPPEAWLALGVTPQPSLLLEAVARRSRPARASKPVERLVLRLERTSGQISGVVLTPDGQPFVRAQVVLSALGRIAHTDGAGRFRFANVPQPLDDDRIEVRAKGFLAVARAGAGTVEVRLGPKE